MDGWGGIDVDVVVSNEKRIEQSGVEQNEVEQNLI